MLLPLFQIITNIHKKQHLPASDEALLFRSGNIRYAALSVNGLLTVKWMHIHYLTLNIIYKTFLRRSRGRLG